MKKRAKVLVTLVVLLVVVGAMLHFTGWLSQITGFIVGDLERIEVVSCLNEDDYVYFYAGVCDECEEQKLILGENAYENLEKVECPGEGCTGVVSVPAWKIGEEIVYGVKYLDELSEISECEVE